MIKTHYILSCIFIGILLLLAFAPLGMFVIDGDASQNVIIRSTRGSGLPNDMWPAFRGDAARTGNTTAEGSSYYNLVWSLSLGIVYSSPVVQYDQIYITHSTGTNCYDLNRTVIWSFNVGSSYSTPIVHNGRVYFVSDMGSLYCLDANATSPGSTTNYWTYTPLLLIRSASSPVTDGKKVFYSTQHSSGLYAVFINNGSFAWSASLGGSSQTESSPAYWDGRVYCGGGNSGGGGTTGMYCFNANNGNSIWTYTAGDVICSTPAIEYGNVYFGCLDAKVYCIDAIGSGGSTTKKWDYTSNPVSSGFFGSPALANDRVYIGSTNDHLYCLNAYGSGGTTTVNWDQTLSPSGAVGICSSPAVTPKYVYIGNDRNILYCRNITTGALEWSNTFSPTGTYGMPNSPSVYKDRVITSSDNGYLYVIQPDLISPVIISTTPSNGANNVDIGTNITITFNETINVSTLTTSSITLEDSQSNAVAGVVTADMSTGVYKAYFTPNSLLEKEESYTLTVTTDVTDIRDNTLDGNGNGLGEGAGIDEYNMTFTTVLHAMPQISVIPTIKPIEDLPFSLDLSWYISDSDTPEENLGITHNSSYGTLNDLELILLYPNGILKDIINISVSDDIFTVYRDIYIEVTPVNDEPIISNIKPLELIEDVTYFLDMEKHITDVDTPYSKLNLSDNSTYTDISGMIINFTYPNGITSNWVNLTVDDDLLSVWTEIQVSIEPVNDPPVIDHIPPVTVQEDITYNISVANYISDIDTPENDLEIIVESQYVAVKGFRLYFTYPEKISTDSLDVKVFDGEYYNNTELKVIVEPVNDPPVIISIISPKEGDSYEFNQSIALLAVVQDPDLPYGDTLKFLWYDHKIGPIAETQNVTDVVLKPGEHMISFSVKDTNGSKAMVNINVTVKDKPTAEEPEQEPPEQETPESDTNETKTTESRSIDIMLIGIGVVVIIIIVILIALMLIIRKKREKAQETPVAEQTSSVSTQVPGIPLAMAPAISPIPPFPPFMDPSLFPGDQLPMQQYPPVPIPGQMTFPDQQEQITQFPEQELSQLPDQPEQVPLFPEPEQAQSTDQSRLPPHVPGETVTQEPSFEEPQQDSSVATTEPEPAQPNTASDSETNNSEEAESTE